MWYAKMLPICNEYVTQSRYKLSWLWIEYYDYVNKYVFKLLRHIRFILLFVKLKWFPVNPSLTLRYVIQIHFSKCYIGGGGSFTPPLNWYTNAVSKGGGCPISMIFSHAIMYGISFPKKYRICFIWPLWRHHFWK